MVAKYYLNDPNAPKPNCPTRIGTNAYVQYDGRLLLEQRWDCGSWGLIGGRLRNSERYAQGIARELREETGIFLPENAFELLRVVDDDRIASYQDGTVWRMIIVLFRTTLQQQPILKPSKESTVLQFFTAKELETLDIVQTHKDLVEQWRLSQQQN